MWLWRRFQKLLKPPSGNSCVAPADVSCAIISAVLPPEKAGNHTAPTCYSHHHHICGFQATWSRSSPREGRSWRPTRIHHWESLECSQPWIRMIRMAPQQTQNILKTLRIGSPNMFRLANGNMLQVTSKSKQHRSSHTNGWSRGWCQQGPDRNGCHLSAPGSHPQSLRCQPK